MTNIEKEKKRIILAITGASGAAIGLQIATVLSLESDVDLHLVVSPAGQRTIVTEIGADALKKLKAMPAVYHDCRDIGATIASGSFKGHGMIIAPCSMRSLAAIACGFSDNLIIRAADVILKERGRLILMTRETPLHLGHLRNMCTVTEMGGIIMPPMPAFYHVPQTINDIIEDLALRAISLLNIQTHAKPRVWDGGLSD